MIAKHRNAGSWLLFITREAAAQKRLLPYHAEEIARNANAVNVQRLRQPSKSKAIAMVSGKAGQ